jgi:hypothetical protein
MHFSFFNSDLSIINSKVSGIKKEEVTLSYIFMELGTAGQFAGFWAYSIDM